MRLDLKKQVYQSIDMRTIFLFGGILSLAIAMETTVTGADVANAVAGLMVPDTPMFVIMPALFLIGGSLAYPPPIGMPANVMIPKPGGYTLQDCAKAGVSLILVSTVVSMTQLPILFPFLP